ncbi:class I SAM-dependent methyltransferase [Nonomuraea jiangxiensis]|nr:class I SAM-dependent methyltransferase [Nonomuraea jiangxiensis]
MPDYDMLIEQAIAASAGGERRGWDFSWLRGRTSGGRPPWSYSRRASKLLAAARRPLDIDTGGGEVLASLAPPPRHMVATEAWQPNIPVAAERLRPYGVVVLGGAADRIPIRDVAFDLVLNRHGGLNAAEVARVLMPNGRLLTQQVGSRNGLALNNALGAPPPADPDGWTLPIAVERLQSHGLDVLDAREEMIDYLFHDIAAVVFQLRAVPWQIRDFDLARYDGALRRLHDRIRTEGPLITHDHRFLIEARRPRHGWAQ